MLIAALLSTAGCGSSLPETVAVHGRVTWQGEPIERGTVAFTPRTVDGDRAVRGGVATIQPNGTYRLSTFGQYDGVIPGEYAVAISDAGDFPFEVLDPDAIPASGVLPVRYAHPAHSGLSATVPAGKSQVELNFDLPHE